MWLFISILVLIFLIGCYTARERKKTSASRPTTHAPEPHADTSAPAATLDASPVPPRASKPRRSPPRPKPYEVTIDTPLGRLTTTVKHDSRFIVIACGRAEDRIRWEFDVYLRRKLRPVVANAKRYRAKGWLHSETKNDYPAYLLATESQFNDLKKDRDAAIAQSRTDLAERRITVLGEYPTLQMLEGSLQYWRKYGWLDLHVVELPPAPTTSPKLKSTKRNPSQTYLKLLDNVDEERRSVG